MNKNSKLMNKITYAIFAIFFFVCVIISASIQSNRVKAANEGAPVLSISCITNEDGYFESTTSTSMIYIYLSLDKAPSTPVKFYFHAEDRTAISEAGDYYLVEEGSEETDAEALAETTHKTSYVTINEFNYKQVVIQYHVSSVDYMSYHIDTNEKYYNYFYFMVELVENATYTGDKAFKCKINNDSTLPVKGEDGTYKCVYFDETAKHKFTYSINNEGSIDSYFNLGADFNEEAWESIYDKTVNNDYGELIANGKIMYMRSSNDNWKDHKFYVYSETSAGDMMIIYEKTDHVSEDGNYYDGPNPKADQDMNEANDLIKIKESYWKRYDYDYGTRHEQWVYLPKSYGYKIHMNIYSCKHYREGWGYISSRITDRVAPKVEDYYVDTSSILSDGKIRLLMRFSEPVDGIDAEITASLQDKNDILFRCVEGSNTNTLVFEANVNTDDLKSQSLSCSYISLKNLSSGITDIGYNWDKESKNSCTFQFEAYEKYYVRIDLRKPEIEEPSAGETEGTVRTRNINVTTNKLTNGTVYYCFVPVNEANKTSFTSVEDFTKVALNASGDYTNFVVGTHNVYQIDADDTAEYTFTIASPPNINGEYYLYILAVSSLGKTYGTKYGRFFGGDLVGGYSFDNAAPELIVDRDSSSTSTIKKYNFTAEDKFNDSNLVGKSIGINEIGLKIYDSSNPNNVVDAILWSDENNIDNTINSNATESNGCFLEDSFRFDITKENEGGVDRYVLKCDGIEIIDLNSSGYGTYNYYFYAIDKLGNITTIDDSLYKTEKYDTRELFNYSWSSNKDNLYSKIDNEIVTGIQENVYNRNTDSGQTLKLSVSNTEVVSADVSSEVTSIYKIYYQNKSNLVYTKGIDASYDEYVSVSVTHDGYKSNLDITPLKSGFYSIEFMMTRTLTGSGSQDLYAVDSLDFYITDRTASSTTYDATANYEKVDDNLVFINKVFQLGTNYYYMNSTDKVTIMPYNNTSSAASFTNSTIASNYVKFMEYQDLQILQIGYDQDGAQIVSFLNSSGGSAKYQKADGQEGIKAALGQTWVRYKRSSWTTSSGNEGWAYYFYSDRLEDKINIATLQGNNAQFTNAISAVTSNIVKLGNYVYLTEESNLDSNNAPYLSAGQQHYSSETATVTITGNQFASTLVFEGDSGIYSDYIEIAGKNYKLATNMKLDISDNKLYYYNKTNKILVPINARDNQTLSQAMGSSVGSGIYRIIEIAGNGVSEFEVYIDNDAPVVSISWVGTGDDADNATFTANLNGRNDGDVYSAKNMIIKSVSSSKDIDPYAYVAVYEVLSYRFVSISYYSTLADNPIILEDGNYYIVVGDRSGNVYQFTAQVCSEDLIVDIKVIDNSYVSITTNRSEEQIDRFEIRCNNIIQNQEYSAKGNKYYESGYYNIYIKDIYGNTNSKIGEFGSNYMFERELPKLTWSYQDSSGNYTTYDPSKSKIMTISTGIEAGTYYINTSRYLKFVYDGEYEYEITGVDSSNITASSIGHYVIIESVQNWELEIWYSSYPDVRAKYIVVMDTTAPTVQVSYRVSTYELAETDNLDIAALTADINSIYKFNSVEYIKGTTITRKVSDGDAINSSFMTLDVSDASGLKSVYVYIDDVLEKKYENIEGKFPSVSLSKSGVYKIVATDSFDNVRTFTYENVSLEKLSASLDNEKINNQENVQYGNNEIKFVTSTDCEIMIKVGEYVLTYRLQDGKLYLVKYICIIEEGVKHFEPYLDTKLVNNEEVLNPFFDKNSSKVMPYTEVEYIANNIQIDTYSTSTKIKGVRFFVSYDASNNIIIRFESKENERLYIEASFLYNEFEEPYYYNLILSKEVSEIDFVTLENDEFDTSYEKVTRINESFKPVLNNINNINKIEVSYSKTKEFINISTLYDKSKGYVAFDTSANGFYLFRVENIFGNVIEYVINRSDEFVVLAFAEYEDKEESSFDNAYGESLIKANSKVKFEAFTDAADNLVFTLKNIETGIATTVKGQYLDGYYSFVFSEVGTYRFTLTDTFGNVAIKNFEIKKTSLDVDDGILTGYNEKALLKDQGYTNKKITIEESKIEENDVKYISLITSIESEDKGVKVVTKTEKIIYNSLTQDAVGKYSKYAYIIVKEYRYYSDNVATLTASNKYIIDLLDGNKVVDVDSNEVLTNIEFTTKLIEAIGADGNNDYQVLFRDSYGGIDKKDVHYKEDSTLIITRKTRSDKEAVEIDIKEAIAKGVWSNANVEFNTTSKKFEFTKIATGETQIIQELPFSINVTADGKYDYLIKYLDEYGNEYAIGVHLVRQELAINLDESIDSFIVEDVITTRNNISVKFTSDATCTYRLNGGEENEYHYGEVLYRDGAYRFTVTDYAGNVTSKTFKKDTICEFTFTVPTTEKTLINGEVINSGYVKFSQANEDTTYISKLYHDDVLVDEDLDAYSKAGKWSAIIEDLAGNKTMFEFYIINHDLSKFEYVTPNNYKITELWYNDGIDDVLIDYMSYVNDNEANSDFTIDENGVYTVVMSSIAFNKVVDFTFTINKSLPNVRLAGCNEGEKTINNVSIDGCKKGDIVRVYKDSKLIKTVEIEDKSDVPTISEGGRYEIVVTNQAGMTKSLSFIRTKVPNTAGSILIIVLSLLAVIGIMIGAILKNRQKIDD